MLQIDVIEFDSVTQYRTRLANFLKNHPSPRLVKVLGHEYKGKGVVTIFYWEDSKGDLSEIFKTRHEEEL